jgi:hypothetical protein
MLLQPGANLALIAQGPNSVSGTIGPNPLAQANRALGRIQALASENALAERLLPRGGSVLGQEATTSFLGNIFVVGEQVQVQGGNIRARDGNEGHPAGSVYLLNKGVDGLFIELQDCEIRAGAGHNSGDGGDVEIGVDRIIGVESVKNLSPPVRITMDGSVRIIAGDGGNGSDDREGSRGGDTPGLKFRATDGGNGGDMVFGSEDFPPQPTVLRLGNGGRGGDCEGAGTSDGPQGEGEDVIVNTGSGGHGGELRVSATSTRTLITEGGVAARAGNSTLSL